MRFCITTLGCKVNQYESQAMEYLLCEQGHEAAALGDGCDVCIINTCAVTAESERKSRQAVRRMKKLEPDAFIAVCGCYSQLNPEAVSKLGVDLVGGISDRAWDRGTVLLSPSNRKTGHKNDSVMPNIYNQSPPVLFEELPPGNTASRTRALLKIQDGCNNFCAYCIVPYIRGRSRSLPLERAREYAAQLEEQGYKEIVVTGIEIASYGKDLMKQRTCLPASEITEQRTCPPASDLIKAIKTIGEAAQNVRIRLGSLSPSIMTEEFCKELSKIPNLCNHFHLSLQSGCDETLKRMGRKYTVNQVLKSIKSIRKYFNNDGEDCGITADLIVGFPGETDEEFNKTLGFIKKAGFSDMHIFPYSIRPGTKAAQLPGQIDKSVKKERAKKAAVIANEIAENFRKNQLSKTMEVLFEQESNGLFTGHSRNYLQVTVKENVKKNCIKKVKITGAKNSILTGEIV